MIQKITITVITVNYNHRAGLERTLRSVIMADGIDQYIVADGASSDGSDNVLAAAEGQFRIPFTWASERDGGTYDAMNRALAKATSDYVLFLNSGDVLASSRALVDVRHSLSGILAKGIMPDLVIGREYRMRNGRRSAGHGISTDEIDANFLISNTLPHQATLIRRELLKQVGGYRLDFPIVADWVFWNEAVVHHAARVVCVPVFIAEMEAEGQSSDVAVCRAEMARYLYEQHPMTSVGDWLARIGDNADAYQYRRATRSVWGRWLVRLALRLNK